MSAVLKRRPVEASTAAGVLSEKENGVRQLHDMVRRALPIARSHSPTPPGAMAATNASM